MRKRYNVSFDPENRRHAEAMRVLYAEPERQRTEFIVDCILQREQANRLEQTVRRIVRDEIRHLNLSPSVSESKEPTFLPSEKDAFLSDIPDSLLHAMDDPDGPSG